MPRYTGRWPIPPAKPETKAPRTQSERPAGRIVHDERGNAVWNWGEKGRSGTESTSTMLKRLEVPDLSVEGQEPGVVSTPAVPAGPAAKGKGKEPGSRVDMGYNPYDQRRAVRKPTEPKAPVVRRKR